MNLRRLRYRWAPQYAWGRLKLWVKDPFIVKVDIYERTRIEHRAFPYRLKITALPLSAQERIDQGGVVHFERGCHHLTEPLVVSTDGVSIIGAHLQNHGAEACLKMDLPTVECEEFGCHGQETGSERGPVGSKAPADPHKTGFDKDQP